MNRYGHPIDCACSLCGDPDGSIAAYHLTLEEQSRETIVAAALRIAVPHPLNQKVWQGKRVYPNFLTVSAPPPARHGTLLHPMHDLGIKHVHPDDQGFLTSKGRFVGRREAFDIATAANQIITKTGSTHVPELYSEDVW